QRPLMVLVEERRDGRQCRDGHAAPAPIPRFTDVMASPDEQPVRELPGGTRMPVLGLGVWQMRTGAETEQAVAWALEAAHRPVDTAALYRNEESVGAALRGSGLPREDVFVTTKLMPARPNAARELDKSLQRLRLDYVDLYLIHWPLPLLYTRQW